MTQQEIRLSELVLCGGCAAKYGAGPLAEVVAFLAEKFPRRDHPNLVVGLEKADDAAVYVLNDQQAIVQTLDFFPPLVDDPYAYGAIAAANAMNDVYAMGGDVLFALNIAAFPEAMPLSVVQRIFEGGADKVREAGGAIAGGHTVIDPEPKYGLSVTGLVHPARIRTNAGAQPGDTILLTKKIGTGVLVGAIRQGDARPAHADAAIEQMMQLNAAAARATRDLDVHAMADVTGFGLAGHLIEISRNSGVEVRLELSALPVLDGFFDYVGLGVRTGGQGRNQTAFAAEMRAAQALAPEQEALLYDPQTCGGLVICLPPSEADCLRTRLAASDVPCWRIGAVAAGGGLVAIP